MRYLTLLFIAFVFLSSCRNERIFDDPEAQLEFSNDSIYFDTVFTSLGSATERLVVYNPYKESIVISEIYLENGDNSRFRINVDGRSGSSIDEVIIRPQDSIFIFAEVTIDPNRADNPMVVAEFLSFETNGNKQQIDLVAFGQDAYYYRPTTAIPGLPVFSYLSSYDSFPFVGKEIMFKADKPHVILGYLLVDSSLTLNIEAGAQIHFFQSSGLWVSQGASLKVSGELDNEVVFQGSRLESNWQDRPGQWDRIWINDGGTSEINYAIIKNGFVGIQAESWPFNEPLQYAQNTLTIQNTVIQNMVGIGLLARDHKIRANNLLIQDCGTYSLAINGGGDYRFVNCSFVNYWDRNRQEPLLFVNNQFDDFEGNTQIRDLSQAFFGNCIIYGGKEEEIEIEEPSSGIFNLSFDHCILRTEVEEQNEDYFSDCIFNPENLPGTNHPLFKNVFEDDYQLLEGSTAVDAGFAFNDIPQKDLNGNLRDSQADIGCYELED